MQIIAFLNRKGGVGKSTLCHHLAGAIAATGRRVLAADLDPQASLTRGSFGDAATDALDPLDTVVSAFDPGGRLPEDVARPAPWDARVSIVPGSVSLGPANDHVPEGDEGASGLGALGPYLRALGGFDVTLVDCPPNLAGCSWAALAAADALVVPLIPEDFGAMGVPAVLEFVARVRLAANPGLRTLGIALNKVERTRLHAAYRDALRAEYGDLVLSAEVGQRVALAESVTGRTAIGLYQPGGKAAAEVASLADEVLVRLAATPAAVAAGMGVA